MPFVMTAFTLSLPRVPELLFQPSMVNVDQSGLVDVIESVLQTYPTDVQQRLVDVR